MPSKQISNAAKLLYKTISLLAFSTTIPASAEEFTIANRSIDIKPPNGYCFVAPQKGPDKKLFDQYNKGSKHPENAITLLLRCDFLNTYRSHPRTFLEELFSSPPIDKTFFKTNALPEAVQTDLTGYEKEFIKDICGKLNKETLLINSEELRDSEIENAFLSQLKIGSPTSIGLLENTPHICYFGGIQNYTDTKNDVAYQIEILSITVRNGLAITHKFSTPYENHQSIDEALKTLKGFIKIQ